MSIDDFIITLFLFIITLFLFIITLFLFIITLFLKVNQEIGDQTKRSDAKLYPDEIVTLAYSMSSKEKVKVTSIAGLASTINISSLTYQKEQDFLDGLLPIDTMSENFLLRKAF